MKVLGKNIIVRRGETFVLSRKVFKDDGRTPFVLPTSILNPYLVISVTSTAYNVEGRYKCNYWLNLANYPKFMYSVPVDGALYIAGNKVPVAGYHCDKETYVIDTCIFWRNETVGDKQVIVYYYAKAKHDANGNILYTDNNTYYQADFFQYSFVFTKQFLEYQTRDWVESQYQYTFKLIGGETTNNVLKGIYDSIYPYSPFRPTDNLTLYNEIKKCRPDMVRNIRPSAPLANYTTEDILQRPEKLIIKQS